MAAQDLILKDDFEGKIDGNIWWLKRVEQHSWEISEEQARNGKSSLKITLRTGDKPDIGRDNKPTERAEFSEKQDILVPLNSGIWYAFSFYFPTNFPIVDNRLLFAQWKQFYQEEKQSPFLSFRYINGQLQFCIMGRKQLMKKYFWTKDPRGIWHDVLVNYQLNESLDGFVDVWINNEILASYHGPLGFDYTQNLVYFKMGLYRDSIDISQTIFLDRFRRGPTKNSCLE